MKVYLAGISSIYSNNLDILKNNNVYLLESFISFQDWEIPLINDNFLLDSGAFTFMTSQRNKKICWEEYIDRYAEFINKNKVKYFFELDIDSVVGYKKVLEYRERLEKTTNKQVIPVWHKSRGLDEYKQMCSQYPYVSIGGIVAKEIKPKDYPIFIPLIKEAKSLGCKIHGLGFTATNELSKYHFDSVDSTNWLYGRYGHYYIKEGGYMHLYRRPRNKHCNQDKLQRHNLSEWVKFIKYAESKL